MQAGSALPSGPLAAVAALWGTDEPVLGLGSNTGNPRERLPDVQHSVAVASARVSAESPGCTTSDAVASLWGSAEPSSMSGIVQSVAAQPSAQVQSLARTPAEDAVHCYAAQPATATEPIFVPQAAPMVSSFPVEPVFQQPVCRTAPAATMVRPAMQPLAQAPPASMARPAMQPSAQMLQEQSQVVCSPWGTGMSAPAGVENPARGLLMQAAPQPRQPQIHNQGSGTVSMATMSNGQGFVQAGHSGRQLAGGSAPGGGRATAAPADHVTQVSGCQGPRDLGAHKAHQLDGDDNDYGRVDLTAQAAEHLTIASPEEVQFHMASMMPPPEARDLGARRQHATQADDLQEMLMPQHMSLNGFEHPAEVQAEPLPQAPPPRVQPQPQVQEVSEPSWVLGAPTVAQDMKRAARYWKDPLLKADFSGAVDYRAMPMQPQAPPKQQAPPPAPGERVYFEERWDQSVLVEPPGAHGAAGAVRSDMGPAVGAAALCYGQVAAQGAGASVHGRRPELQGETCRAPAPGASGLASRLDSVISQLEGHGDAESAVEDLRDIEASYNAALNARRM